MIKKTKKGFTLAEVLAALAVIGILAALTIPNLMQDFQKASWTAGAKEGYSIISRALHLLRADNYGSLAGNCFSGDYQHEQALNCIAPKLKVVKNCGLTASGCFPNVTYKEINGDDAGNVEEDNHATLGKAKALLSNGMSIVVYDYPGDCNHNNGPGAFGKSCGDIYIDINGHKGPNTFGRDYFKIQIADAATLPLYAWVSPNSSVCNPSTGSSGGCLARIIKEGKMDY